MSSLPAVIFPVYLMTELISYHLQELPSPYLDTSFNPFESVLGAAPTFLFIAFVPIASHSSYFTFMFVFVVFSIWKQLTALLSPTPWPLSMSDMTAPAAKRRQKTLEDHPMSLGHPWFFASRLYTNINEEACVQFGIWCISISMHTRIELHAWETLKPTRGQQLPYPAMIVSEDDNSLKVPFLST